MSGQDEKETERLEAFSDGVFAIAITLLVLELRVPHADEGGPLGRRLLAQWPSYLAYLASFANIGIMWLNHHLVFQLVRRVDRTLLVLNGLLLLCISIVPFPTSLVASYLGHPGERLAACIYAGSSFPIAIAYNLLWRYVTSTRRTPSMLRVPHDDPQVTAITGQYRFGPVFYLIALGVSLVNPVAGVATVLLLALFFLLPFPIRLRPRDV